MTPEPRPKLIVTRGPPASGKTTWAEKVVAESLQDLGCETSACDIHGHQDLKVLRVNRDDLRGMLHGGRYLKGVTEEVVVAVRDAAIKAALAKGWDVINDDTNLRMSVARHLHKLAFEAGANFEVNDTFLDVTVEDCVIRDNWRARNDERSVGEDVILDQHNRFLKGKGKLPFPELPSDAHVFEPLPHGDQPAYIFDLDGTTALNNGHRGFYEYDRVKLDEPKRDVIGVAQDLLRMGATGLFVSGRNDACRDDTAEWIWEHILQEVTVSQNIYPKFLKSPNDEQDARHKLFMRRDGDMRDDAILKYEIYRDFIAPDYDVKMAFDDRDRVVKMWRAVGITTSQVAYGDF